MNELFNGIEDTDKIRLLQALESITSRYEKNKIILSSVKRDNIVCIVSYGHIQVVRYDKNGNQIILEDLHDGDMFGSITSNIASRSVDIISKEPSEVIIFELDNIINFNIDVPGYDQLLKNILNIFIVKHKEVRTHLEIVSKKTIRDKLLAYFRTMSKSENRSFILPMSLSNLAEYLATNRSAMSRELKALKDEGLIEIKGKKIKILYYM
jgi:CRP-like cAMP-binding protein